MPTRASTPKRPRDPERLARNLLARPSRVVILLVQLREDPPEPTNHARHGRRYKGSAVGGIGIGGFAGS
jgi:hypothetical protein